MLTIDLPRVLALEGASNVRDLEGEHAGKINCQHAPALAANGSDCKRRFAKGAILFFLAHPQPPVVEHIAQGVGPWNLRLPRKRGMRGLGAAGGDGNLAAAQQ